MDNRYRPTALDISAALHKIADQLRTGGATKIHLRAGNCVVRVIWEASPITAADAGPAFLLPNTPALPAPVVEERIERGHVLIRDERLQELEEKARCFDAMYG